MAGTCTGHGERKPAVVALCAHGCAGAQYMLQAVAPLVALRAVAWEKRSVRQRLQMLWRRGRRAGWLRLADRMLLALYGRVRLRKTASECQECRMLRDAGRSQDVPCPQVIVASVNDPAVVNLLREYSPDLVLVWGTSIIKPHVLEAAPCFVNVHAGITPLYRGAHGAVWAVIRRDFANVGVTIHRVDRGIDTGEILGQVAIELEPRCDNLITLEAKQAVAGANALAQWIARNEPPFADGPSAAPPPGESRFYNSPGLRDYRRFQKILKSIR